MGSPSAPQGGAASGWGSGSAVQEGQGQLRGWGEAEKGYRQEGGGGAEAVRRRGAVSIGSILTDFSGENGPQTYSDGQRVTIAGIISRYKTKTTKNNSLMAYVTVEDDTAYIEMMAFSNVLSQHGGDLKENSAVVVTGRLSIRDEKEPQIVINRVRPISDFSEQQPALPAQEPAGQVLTGTLWLKLSGQDDPKVRKVKAIVKMFPGSSPVKLFFADIRKSSTGSASLDSRMLTELKNVLGEENVVVK